MTQIIGQLLTGAMVWWLILNLQIIVSFAMVFSDLFQFFKNIIFYYFSYLSYLVVFVGLIEIKSITISGKGQVAIPKASREKAGFKEGTKIAILNFDDHIELRRMDEIEERFGSAFASEKSLGKEWNTKEEDKRWKNL